MGATHRMTITEKIIALASGLTQVRPGDEVWARVDLAVMNDSSGPRRLAALVEDLGGKLWNPERVVLVSDHFIPPSTIRHAEILSITRDWARRMHISHFYEYEGILHNVLIEKRLVRPGMLLVGADSHTTTAGAVGAVAIPIGSSELATVLVSGEVWLRVPSTICIRLHGHLRPGVMPRDVAFFLLGTLRSDCAVYKAVEFHGTFVQSLDIAGRSVLTNAGIEMGAKNAIVPADEVTAAFYGETLADKLRGDSEASFEKIYQFDVSTLEPMVALPHQVDNVATVREVQGKPIDLAYLGSCVGAKLEDLRAAAQVLRGRRTAVPLLVTPATRAALESASRDGTLSALIDAGAIVQPAGCGPCAGVHMGILGPHQRAITSLTRNFRGRMGARDAEIYLASPMTVAASALNGRITDPTPYLEGEA